MNKLKHIVYPFLFLISISSFSQLKEYTYKRKISGIEKQWHHLQLPNAIFSEVDKSMADLRVYGITSTDTIEAPYILKPLKSEIKSINIPFKMLNESHNKNGYYYTFTTKKASEINRLFLNIDQDNFDWKVTLEGSDNQKEWFTVVEDYRIVAIKNSNVLYRFTDLVLPNSNYNSYRLLIKTNENPNLTSTNFKRIVTKKGQTRQYKIASKKNRVDKKTKQSIITIELAEKVSLNRLHLNIDNTTDYYRHYTLSYLSNRFKTEKGWIENYTTITSGVLNSLDNNQINFDSVLAKKLKLEIYNQDNTPLQITSFTCAGNIYQLTARFDHKQANYFLVSGRKNDRAPNYDIVRFATQIPKNNSALILSSPITIEKIKTIQTQPLFTNKMWLWGVMFIIIVLLGWFSVKMMRAK